MHRFINGEDRTQQTLLPNSLEDYVGEENPVRVIEVFIDELDLAALGFAGMTPAATRRQVTGLLCMIRRPARFLALGSPPGVRCCNGEPGGDHLVRLVDVA